MWLQSLRQTARFALMAGLLSLALAACGGPTSQPEPLALTLRAQDIKFDMNTMRVKVRQPVALSYINQGVIDHALVIDDLVAGQTVTTGQTTTFNFTPSTAGSFKFYCAIPGHAAAGMTGELIVTQ